MFRFSEAVCLAFRAMVLLASEPERRISSGDFAEALQASKDHLAKVLSRLVRVGYLSSVRGPGGGFRLERPADTLTLLDIYRAIEGDLHPLPCVFGEEQRCPEEPCLLGDLPSRISNQVVDYLSETRLSELVARRARRLAQQEPEAP